MPTSKQRRAAERRRLRRQAQRRQQQAARRRQLNVILSVVGTLLIIALVVTLIAVTSGGSDSKPKAGASTSRTTSAAPSTPAASPTTSAKTSATSSANASSSAASSSAVTSSAASSSPAVARTSAVPAVTTTCSYPRSGTAARKVSTPSTKAATSGTASVRLATSRGAMTFTLDRTAAPCAVNSFLALARQKFYDNTSCHRLVTKSIFLLQCGDPTGTGRGGPGYRFADELGTDPVFRRGAVVMANGGPNTNGSQFFIIDRDTRLGDTYTPLGTVTSGLSVADAVYRAGTSDGSSDGPPKLRLTFRTLTIG